MPYCMESHMLLIEQSCFWHVSRCLNFLCNIMDYNLPAEPAVKTCKMINETVHTAQKH